MAEANPKLQPYPPAVEEDEEEEEEKSTLPDEQVEREAEQALREIEEEVEEDHPTRPPRPPPVTHEGPETTFVDKAWDAQYRFEARLKAVGHGRFSRVLKMARKPEHEEFVKASKITAIGIAVVGTLGFLILLFMNWLQAVLGVR